MLNMFLIQMFRIHFWTSRCCFSPLLPNMGDDREPSKNHINFQERVPHQILTSSRLGQQQQVIRPYCWKVGKESTSWAFMMSNQVRICFNMYLSLVILVCFRWVVAWVFSGAMPKFCAFLLRLWGVLPSSRNLSVFYRHFSIIAHNVKPRRHSWQLHADLINYCVCPLFAANHPTLLGTSGEKWWNKGSRKAFGAWHISGSQSALVKCMYNIFIYIYILYI